MSPRELAGTPFPTDLYDSINNGDGDIVDRVKLSCHQSTFPHEPRFCAHQPRGYLSLSRHQGSRLDHRILRILGSNKSRIRSPAKFRHNTVMKMAIPGQKEIHHALSMKRRPSKSMLPQEGVGGCTPRPR